MLFTLDKEKYRNIILYLIDEAGHGTLKGKKKLYKLLYFLDFDFFEKNGKPITGDIYRRIQMGPAPRYADAIIEEMRSEGIVLVKTEGTGKGLKDTTLYQSSVRPDLTVFSGEEKEMLKRTVRLYGNKTGKELEELTHKDAPHLAVEEGEDMPYELSFYRGTDF